MSTKTSIIVKLQVEGIHFWKDAAEVIPEMDYLAHPHRHIFHIKCEKRVRHDDRDVEIIMFKREIIEFITTSYGSPAKFGGMSCEMIAAQLQHKFGLMSCEVLEDNENGARVELI